MSICILGAAETWGEDSQAGGGFGRDLFVEAIGGMKKWRLGGGAARRVGGNGIRKAEN